jgi:hypothetical protein
MLSGRKSGVFKFDQMAQIILDDVVHCGGSLQTLNTYSGDQLYKYYRFVVKINTLRKLFFVSMRCEIIPVKFQVNFIY